jgi:hypothetical protein
LLFSSMGWKQFQNLEIGAWECLRSVTSPPVSSYPECKNVIYPQNLGPMSWSQSVAVLTPFREICFLIVAQFYRLISEHDLVYFETKLLIISPCFGGNTYSKNVNTDRCDPI